MKCWIQSGIVIVALAHSAAAPGFGESFRCGVKKIEVGDSEQDLLDACGRPSSRRSSMQNVRDPSGKVRAVRIENYVYEDRERRTTVHISVADGEIIRIDNR